MRNVICLLSVLVIVSCSPTKTKDTGALYQVLVSSENGGGNFQFYEIFTEAKEFKMLLGDDELKKLVQPNDINTSNFIVLNMGEKTTLGYSISVQNVEETSSKIIITTKDNEPKSKQTEEKEVFYYPYTIVKVNSKKEIVVQ